MEKYYRWFLVHWVEVLVGCYIFFIIFTTVVPFRFVFDIGFIPHRFQRINWIPLFENGRLLSRSDTLANIIFFIPLGILLGLQKILREYRNWYLREWVQIVATGFAISLFVEILQIFTYNRQPSANDLLMNTVGTFLGALLILNLYLRFHKQIKSFLFSAFANKTEMVIAGFFLVFIFLNQSAPFTFNISPGSATSQLVEFRRHPFAVENPLADVLHSLLIYGTFTYFLLCGILRYHRRSVFAYRWFYFAGALFLLPVILEIYQFLLPQRNHSLADIFLAWGGILFGAGFEIIRYRLFMQARKKKPDFQITFTQQHNLYFTLAGAIYFIYLVNRFLLPIHMVHKWELLAKNLQQSFSWSFFYLAKMNRLNFLISLLKETFTFLPFGFIISLWWFVRFSRPISIYEMCFLSVLFPGVLYTIAVFIKGDLIIWPDVLAGIPGVWLGFISWQVYNYMMERMK